MQNTNKRSITIALALIIAIGLFSSVSAKQVEYPFGFKHGMSQDDALTNLHRLGATITKSSSSSILADYNHEYDGITVVRIYLSFFDGQLSRVALDSDGTTSADEHRAKLQSVSDYLKSEYNISRISNSAPVNSETDLKKRYICRFQDNGFEILIYSFYDNGVYSMSLNFVKIFAY